MKSKNDENSYNNKENSHSDRKKSKESRQFKKLKAEESGKQSGKNIKELKKLKAEENGNFPIIIAGLFLISFLILSIILLNLAISQNDENEEAISSNNFNYIISDYKRNLEIIEREVLEEMSIDIINSRTASSDSKKELKERIDDKLAIKNQEYYENYNILINSSIVGIENCSDPFSIKFKTYISSVKGDLRYENILEDDVNVEGLCDPIPFIYCGKDSSFKYNETKINYGNSLAKFLKSKGIANYSYYINATSPRVIRKCPYDPYVHHGDGFTMKNCRDNGYFHESADGACYLCRLEGNCGCNHYGFETFINPQKTNLTNLSSACGSDHVIFEDGTYPGVEVVYYSEDGLNEILFLDPHGHKLKYGMSNY